MRQIEFSFTLFDDGAETAKWFVSSGEYVQPDQVIAVHGTPSVVRECTAYNAKAVEAKVDDSLFRSLLCNQELFVETAESAGYLYILFIDDEDSDSRDYYAVLSDSPNENMADLQVWLERQPGGSVLGAYQIYLSRSGDRTKSIF